MAFKINVSSKGKTLKLESENENLIGKKIGESIDGSDISEDLKGYTVEITGTSDISGIPGKKRSRRFSLSQRTSNTWFWNERQKKRNET